MKDRKSIIEDIKAGLSYGVIAKKNNCSYSTVYKIAKTEQIEGMTESKKKKIRNRKIAKTAKERGLSIKEAAKEFDVSYHIAKEAFRQYNINNGESHKIAISTYYIIADLLNTDLPNADIAKKHGITKERVRQISELMLKAGIKFNKRIR